MSKGRFPDPLRNRLPLVVTTAPRSDLPCQNPGEVIVAKIREHHFWTVPLAGAGDVLLSVGEGDRAAPPAYRWGHSMPVPWEAAPDGAPLALVEDPALCYAGKSHQIVEHNGCTSNHLPALCGIPLRLKVEEAIFAILAARMAFSNLPMRSLLR